MKTDREILQDVLNELKWDPRVLDTDVGAEVDNGVVTLTGTVESYAQALGARQAAHRVAGVLDVANEIKIELPSGYRRTDTDIAQAVRQTLDWSVAVPSAGIQSTIADGWVTLEGCVEFAFQRDAAVRTVEELTGVRGVTNLIKVKVQSVDAAEIKVAIEDALERRAERVAKNVQVSVYDGKVTLHGSVHSWPELNAVVGAASHTRGVRDVENHLRIEAA